MENRVIQPKPNVSGPKLKTPLYTNARNEFVARENNDMQLKINDGRTLKMPQFTSVLNPKSFKQSYEDIIYLLSSDPSLW